jgi:RimJ/RimL family protein N-acetyltransferase
MINMNKSQLIYDESSYVIQWVLDKIAHVDDFGPAYGIGVVSGGKLQAGCIYHDCQPAYKTIQLSMAASSPLWAKRDIIKQLLQYPFNHLDCYRVFTITPIENERAIRVNSSIGFIKESIANSGFGKNKHAQVMRLLHPEFIKLYGAI